ncbi:MAG: response regulator transcription factor [Proteobacteria bacterium]|nr:response regulator transcription factor [Pseudomonadota bacterium]MBU4469684.1 response regulator transcription factor [Pseudomonadota bacterium]MCG2751767.1 response regulator transcription factor [Desulfobacteraceae bacterium]
MKQPKARILIVEDDPAILNGLRDVLVFNGFSAHGISDGLAGLSAILNESFDLVLLDVMLPGMDGFSICKQVREKKPGQSIIMITAKGAEDDIVNGFKAGADDYVPKPFSLRELMVRVESVLRRSGKHLGDERITRGDLVFDGLNLQMSHIGRVEELTRREMDIIVYLHRHQDRIVPKKELLTEVWHYADADIETRTVDIHMLKLRKKITTLDKDLVVIRTVRGEGYRWEPRS